PGEWVNRPKHINRPGRPIHPTGNIHGQCSYRRKCQKKAGKPRQERVRIILKAAEMEFALNGFRGATVQGIADLAGLPKPNVLYYFANKQALYDAVLANVLDLWNRELDNILPEDDPALSLERYIRSKVEVSRKHPYCLSDFCQRSDPRGPHAV
ncbi:MAG: TetR family transcriptional regulator, partial [Endozoicomonas sp.]